MKWMTIALVTTNFWVGVAMLTIISTAPQVWAEPVMHSQGGAQALNMYDLKALVALSNQLKSERGPIQDVIFVPGLKSIDKSCQQAWLDQAQLSAYNRQVYERILSKTSRPGLNVVEWTPAAQAAPILRDEKIIPMLNKSIHNQIAYISGQLPSQTLVTDVLSQDGQKSLYREMANILLDGTFSSGPLQSFVQNVSKLKLNDPKHIVANAAAYLQTLDSAVNGSLSGYGDCVHLINATGVEAK